MHLQRNHSSESSNYNCFLFFFEIKAMVKLIYPHQGLIKEIFCKINGENICLNFLFSL